MTPAEQAQKQAEQAMDGFILWSKRITYAIIVCLLVVMVGCNNGVETGPDATGSGYNGEQYDPYNLKVK